MKSLDSKAILKRLKQDFKSQGATGQTLDEENVILREEIRTLESAKITGQKLSMKELEKYGNVNLRSSKASRSLIQDGGKLKPVKATVAKSVVDESISLRSVNRSRHALNSMGGDGGSSNRSRLVIRDNALGTTDVISKTPSKPSMIASSIRNAKASVDGKLANSRASESSKNQDIACFSDEL